MLRAVFHLIHRELLMALRQRGRHLQSALVLPHRHYPVPARHRARAPAAGPHRPGIIWVAALLAAMLSLERLFRDDFSDGALEQMMLMPHPLGLLALAKVIAHWLLTGLPLLLISPLLAILLSPGHEDLSGRGGHPDPRHPVLSLLGAVGVALTAGLRKGGVLLSLLLLPLYIPVLIFATSAIDAASMGLPHAGQLAILGPCWWGPSP